MKNGTYNFVICFSQWAACLKIAIWYETPWDRGQHTTLYLTTYTYFCVASNHYFALWARRGWSSPSGVVWGQDCVSVSGSSLSLSLSWGYVFIIKYLLSLYSHS